MDFTNNGTSPNPNGCSIFPGTTLTGPAVVGNVFQTDGTGNLAGVGGQVGTANTGIAVVAQSWPITQAASTGQSAGVYLTPIVIPAQSQILRITLMVTTAWTGSATTMGVGATAGTTHATAFTTATGVQGSTTGAPVAAAPSTTAQIANWDNVSNSTFQSTAADVQIVVASVNTGSGAGTLTVEYIPGINNAS
jgi:hypothetical protein